jgi:prepilin-type N-terminal cleavage/methylation domain-containing protein
MKMSSNVANKRGGMTLVEVIVALSIFASALLAMAAFAGRFGHAVSEGSAKTTAVELATEKIETVKSATKYSTIETLFAGTESSISGFTGFTRQTIITRVGGGPADMVDYKIVTVIVTNPALKAPIKKTSIIAEF